MSIEVQCPYCEATRELFPRPLTVCCREWGNRMRTLNNRQEKHRELVLMCALEEMTTMIEGVAADLASRKRPGRPKKSADPDRDEPISADAED